MTPFQPIAPRATVATLDYAPALFSPKVRTFMYGSGSQSAYQAAGEQAIESIALKIFAYKAALIESSTAKNPFLTLLKELSQRRHRHAVEAKSPSADAFGQSRESTLVPFREQILFLDLQYKKWGDHLKTFIATQLVDHLGPIATTSLPKENQFSLEDHRFEQRTRLTFDLSLIATLEALELEVYDCKKGGIMERLRRYLDTEVEFRYHHDQQFYRDKVLQTPQIQAIVESRVRAGELPEKVIEECIVRLKKTDQESLHSSGKFYRADLAVGRCLGEARRAEPYPDYEQIRLSTAIKSYIKAFPTAVDLVGPSAISTDFAANARTHFLILTLSHTLDLTSTGLKSERFEPLTRYFVPLQINPGDSLKSVLGRMADHVTPYIVHQDGYLIKKTLQLCSSLFEKIMLWKVSESPTLLKEQMAGLIWLLAHNHRDARGTAAETEWLERAIYKAHGFAMRALATRMIDCLALTTPLLSEFLPAYLDSFTLEPSPLIGEAAVPTVTSIVKT